MTDTLTPPTTESDGSDTGAAAGTTTCTNCMVKPAGDNGPHGAAMCDDCVEATSEQPAAEAAQQAADAAGQPDENQEYVGDDMRSKVPAGTLVERSVGLAPAASGDGRTLEGYAAVFGERAEVNNPLEGHFFETVQRGAFAKTIADGKMPALLFDHGQHATLGRLPIGTIQSMREDERGLWVEARLTDSPAVEPIRAAIADGAIAGMSVRMRIVKEAWAPPAKGSRIAERSIKEVGLVELGPTAFPVYESTTASTRSVGTDTEAGSTGEPAATTPTAVGRVADLSSFRMRAKAILAGALDPIQE
jgi:HK97 family phage prohead protease